MPFDWIVGSPNPAGQAERWRDQYVRGIRQRAKLLYNLRFSEAAAAQRIQAALAWEFDPDAGAASLPAFHGEVPDIVAGVYAHARRGRS